MPIIVNADDFGYNHDINMAILQAFEEGLINRTTLMANMPAAREAMELAKEKELLGFVGVHLNLTSGVPIDVKMRANRTMCDDSSEFTADFARDLKKRFFLDRKTSADVKNELTAQLDMYGNLGGSLWHIDSHHHVHTDPSIWRVIRKIIKNYPIKSVRLGRNMYKGGNPLMRIFKVILNSSIRKFNASKWDYFGSMEDFISYTDSMSEDEKKKFIDNHDIEIMVHPMYDESGVLTDSMQEFVSVL